MYRYKTMIAVTGILGLVLFFVGCSIFNPLGSDGESSAVKNVARTANVSMRVEIPEQKNSMVMPSILANSGTSVTVTFRLTTVNPGNTSQPVSVQVKTVVVDASGTASVTFYGVPAQPTLGNMRIDNGNIQGWSDFHGAMDLADGENTMVVTPKGSRSPTDIIANAIEALIETPSTIAKAPLKLVGTVETAFLSFSGETETPTVYNDLFNRVIEQIQPDSYVQIVIDSITSNLQGFQNSTSLWSVDKTTFWQGSDLTSYSTGARVDSVVRQGMGGVALTRWTMDQGINAIAKLDTANGARIAHVQNKGPIRQILTIRDPQDTNKTLVIGGGHNIITRTPVIFAWNSEHDGSVDTGVGQPINMAWVRNFTEFVSTADVVEPAVESISFDGIDTLTVGVRDPGVNQVKMFLYRFRTAEWISLNPNVTPNRVPAIQFVNPANMAQFPPDQPITLVASATDFDGSILACTFFANESFIATVTSAPFSTTWTPGAIGTYTLIAQATDNLNAVTRSAPLTVLIVSGAAQASPVLLSHSPASGSTNVATGTAITATFDQEMASDSFTLDAFRLLLGENLVSTSISTVDNRTWSLIPTQPLQEDATYTVLVASSVRSISGQTLGTDRSWFFFTAAAGSLPPVPAITSRLPAPGSINVSATATISISFDQLMASSTFNADTFRVYAGDTQVAGNIGTSDLRTYSFTSNQPFMAGSMITVNIAGLVKSSAGVALNATDTWSFTIIASQTGPLPNVTGNYPAPNSTNVASNTIVSITFDQLMASETINTDSFKVELGGNAVNGLVTSSDAKTWFFTPAQSLQVNATYTASVASTAQTLSGQPLGTPNIWNFFVADGIASATTPVITNRLPTPDSINIPATSTVSVTFDQLMASNTVNAGSFLVFEGSNPVAGTIQTGDLQTFTFLPGQAFAASSSVSVTIGGAVKTLAGATLGASDTWFFSVASPPPPATASPIITARVPAVNASNIPATTTISVTFDQVMASATMTAANFRVNEGVATITGTINTSNSLTWTFTPAAPLSASSTITVTISGFVANLTGQTLGSDASWSFSTAAATVPSNPVITGRIPAINAANVSATTTVLVTFDQEMASATMNITNFRVNEGVATITGTISTSDNLTWTFTPAAPLTASSTITVSISGSVANLTGQTLGSPATWNFFTAQASVVTNPLVITEVSSSEYTNSFRWLELYNNTDSTLDLSDFILRSQSVPRGGGSVTTDSTFTLPSHSVAGRSYVVLRVKGSDTNIFDGTQLVHILGAGDIVPYWSANGFAEIFQISASATSDFVRWGTNTQTPTTAAEWTSGAAPALPSTFGNSIARAQTLDDNNAGTDWTLRTFPTPGGPNDVTSDIDADADGIPDSCEASGKTFIGLPLYDWGARPGQKDVFIHIDYMNSADLGINPRKDAIDKVIQVFQTRGYYLHPDAGTLFGSGVANHNLDGNLHQIAFAQYLYLGVQAGSANLYEIKAQQLTLPKRSIFYYCIFGNEQQSGSTGLGEVNGNDYLVSLGSQTFAIDTTENINYLNNIMAATFMHEFGHNLGLRHGGDEDVNYKSNYGSAMNYLYSNWGLPQVGNTREGDRYYHKKWSLDGFSSGSAFYQYFSTSGSRQMHNSPWTTDYILDFSDGAGGILNENTLTESAGIMYAGSGGVDWNGDGDKLDSLAMDTNFDSVASDSFHDFNDWANINILFMQKSSGISQAVGGFEPPSYSFIRSDLQEVVDEPPVILPHNYMR